MHLARMEVWAMGMVRPVVGQVMPAEMATAVAAEQEAIGKK